ncbi:MAG: acyl-CoA dehydratase activase, partial [Desulfovibrionaceae bacterium]|nr:acyl-CoA dehydratase activase [Desulfovibrionaceae bacterium]
MRYAAGIDSGSVSVKLAVLDQTGRPLWCEYRRHKGRPLACALETLEAAAKRFPDLEISVTGSSGRLLAEALKAPHINELSAFALSTARLHPEVATIFEMGGEDSKYLLLDGPFIKDFSLNSVCAAGTGSFLDQQAERMRLGIEEFAALALESKRPARIAGRCSVFAKSDMIHLQQIATPLEDIVAGLCRAVARNFQGAIVRGRPLREKTAFMGGVSLNRGVVEAFKDVFGLEELFLPETPTHMGALGAAMRAEEDGLAAALVLDGLRLAVGAVRPMGKALPRLISPGDGFRERHLSATPEAAETPAQGPTPAYLGIDVGSISTNLALVDEAGGLLAKRYLMTSSRPIEAVRQGLAEIRDELAAKGLLHGLTVKGVGTTGSGRYMIADFVRADVVKNEITAQATAAVAIDPEVDTIFEIGGQDSKFISLKNGAIVDFEMNKACAAGTGSFLEEQAEKLDVAIKGEFQDLALAAEAPCPLGERCTVFMENSLQSNLQRGAGKDDVLAGLAYSIVQNYINRVVSGRRIGRRVFFQGGTAFNKSVTAAFEKHLGLAVTVPPNHDVTGAIGMALIAREHMRGRGASTFRGFDLANTAYSIKSFECKECENRCKINRVALEGVKEKLFYGGRCEKYDIRRSKQVRVPDLFAFRRERLIKAHQAYAQRLKDSGNAARLGRIGLPLAFFMHDELPWHSTLLWELGFEPVPSPWTNRQVVGLGVKAVLADTCFPIKAALGHARSLAELKLPLYIPSCINTAAPGEPSSLACPLTQSFPYQVRAHMRAAGQEVLMAAPIIRRQYGPRHLEERLFEALRPWGVKRSDIRPAMAAADRAQAEFTAALERRGQEVLDGLEERALVITGRAYNALDPGLNLDIPVKLASLDVLTIPMDLLPLERIENQWPQMYWRSGRRLLKAAWFVRRHPLLYALQIGSFSCGPDSFIEKYVDKVMGDKPMLRLEIDEHSADAGALTRCEAFLDSIESHRRNPGPAPDAAFTRPVRRAADFRERVVYGPLMSDHCLGLAAALRACGLKSEVLPETDAESMALARRFVSGKECYPCAVTTGDMVKKALGPDFDPERSAFFMPGGTGPCRFGQYSEFQRLVLDRLGLEEVPLFSPMQDVTMYEHMHIRGGDFARRSWEGVVAFDLLIKCLHKTRPYEKTQGSADELYAKCRQRLARDLAVPGKDVVPTLAGIRRAFEALPRNNGRQRPLIGVVGEIFVRSNRFSNEDLVRRIEDLGGEVWLAGVDEWVYYINYLHARRTHRTRDWKKALQIAIKSHIQKKTARRFESGFEGFLEAIHEPPIKHVLDKARPYLDDSVHGEAVLTIGKSVDMARPHAGRPAAGVVSAIPFGCMPGTIGTG